jgi:hypothetical protein
MKAWNWNYIDDGNIKWWKYGLDPPATGSPPQAWQETARNRSILIA